MLLLASLFVGTTTFFVLSPLIKDLFDHDQLSHEAWNRQQLRLQKLRNGSMLFHSCEQWILGLARFIERRMPWAIQPRRSDTTPRRLIDLLLTTLLGAPKTIDEAVRIRTNEEPWKVSELVATGLILGTGAFCCTAILLSGSFPLAVLLMLSFSGAFVAYRIWLGKFVARARARQLAVRQLLPHAIDTVAMIMQSGGTFLAGIESVASDFPQHAFSEELQVMRNRLDRGQPMKDAVEGAAAVICLPEFDEVARVLNRIHEHGAPSTESFLRLSKQMRLAHLRRMEEQVGRAESKMAFPTMLVLLSCMLVCLGPFLLSMLENNVFE